MNDIRPNLIRDDIDLRDALGELEMWDEQYMKLIQCAGRFVQFNMTLDKQQLEELMKPTYEVLNWIAGKRIACMERIVQYQRWDAERKDRRI